MTFTLRDYQQECLSAIYDGYRQGVRRQLVSLPTGSGKTVIFSEFPRFFQMKKQLLILAHREELLDQACAKLKRANPDLTVGVEQAERKADPNCNVIVASIPTLGRKDSKRLRNFDPEHFFLIVVDEAHHATADTYQRVLEYFGVFASDTQKLLVGFTATPKRGDGQGLDEVFEKIVFSRSLPEMIQSRYLSPVAGYRVETDIDLSRVKTRMGDFVTSHLSREVNVQQRNELVVKVYNDHLKGRQTLCFCVDVDHAYCLTEAFNRSGTPAAAVSGEMDRPTRSNNLQAFAAGGIRILCNCMVLTEGFDEPSVAGIILARPTQSTLLYTQMIGRGTRLHPEKDNVTVVDIVDNTRAHGLTTLASLFGLAGDFDLEGTTTDKALEAMQWVEHNRPWIPLDQATSVSDLRYRCRKINLLDLETPGEIQHCSEFAWVHFGKGGYRLGLEGGEAIMVFPTILNSYEVVLRRRAKTQTIAQERDLGAAITASEAALRRLYPDAVGLVSRRTRWRRAPASDKQVQFLRNKKIDVPPTLTKGAASHIIGMLTGRH